MKKKQQIKKDKRIKKYEREDFIKKLSELANESNYYFKRKRRQYEN